MIGNDALTWLILGSVIVGIISAAVPSGLGKLIALLTSFPLISFLALAATFGANMTELNDRVNFLYWFFENFTPLFIGYAFEGAGVTITKGVRKALRI